MPDAVDQELINLGLHRITELVPAGQRPLFDPEMTGKELRHATREVLKDAPRHLVTPYLASYVTEANGDPIQKSDSTLLPLPDEYHAVYAVKLSTWSMPATEMHDPEVGYAIDRGAINQGYGTKEPIMILWPFTNSNGDVETRLRLFPGDSADDPVEDYMYVETVEPGNVSHELQDPIAWDLAARLLESDKDFMQLAQVAWNRRDKLLRNLGKVTTQSTSRTPTTF